MKKRSLLSQVLPIVLGLLLLPVLAHASGKVSVFVSILPQRYFLERIGGDAVDVSVMVMPGASPATYEPTPRQMAGLTRAKAYFSIGVPFERTWLSRIAAANPAMAVVRTDEGIDKQPIGGRHHHEEAAGHGHDDHEHVVHDHGHGHDHGILDPHVWLSPRLAKTMAGNICRGLSKVDPANRAAYEANLEALLSDIDALDGRMRAILDQVPANKRIFMVFHPSWGYFAREFGLEQIPIEAGGKEPSPRDLAGIVTEGREKGIDVVFVQPQFSDRSAKVIAAEMGARVVPLNPLAGDWADNMLRAAEAFRKALE
jgi:zinc transport system substrate-binding protein